MAADVKSSLDFSTDIQFVKGVGPKFANLFRKIGIHTAGDALYHFPRRYEDRTKLPKLNTIKVGDQVTVRGKIIHVESKPSRGRVAPTKAILYDGTGQIVLVWFNQPWIARKLLEARGEVLAYGTVKENGLAFEMHNPDYETVEDVEESDRFGAIVPIYRTTEGLPAWMVRRACQTVARIVGAHAADPLPPSILRRAKLVPLPTALYQVHLPESNESLDRARYRLAFDEFFAIQLLVQLRRAECKLEPGIKFPLSDLTAPHPVNLLAGATHWAPGENLWTEIHRILPFELTKAQRRVIDEVFADMEKPLPMNRLVQGDVGSGKTAVAACAMLGAVRCGYQACLMAPTEILADQHAMNLRRLFEPLNLEVTLLVGKLTAKQKKAAVDAIRSGRSNIIVGTQAVIQDSVDFLNLGLVVVDEQHRFGVRQRLALRHKSSELADVLVMTATPIPRTLAMTFYGDLDVSIIDELPPGRKPIKTHWKKVRDRDAVYESTRTLLDQGRQAYFVCPAIADSEKLQAQAAVDLHYRLQNGVFKDYRVGLLHGQLKSAEKADVMSKFVARDLDVLVATVVIEVGVDVPNASVMVIEDANRFGLSQLHQIRGRVGRGEHASYCILIADATTEDAAQRLSVMVRTQDGFQIADVDLNLRGAGDILGTAQSGNFQLKIGDLAQDLAILQVARDIAKDVIDADPSLSELEHAGLARLVQEKRQDDAWMVLS